MGRFVLAGPRERERETSILNTSVTSYTHHLGYGLQLYTLHATNESNEKAHCMGRRREKKQSCLLEAHSCCRGFET